MMGHNSIPAKLDMAAHDARAALGRVEGSENDMMAAWVAYGAALLVGKKLTKEPDCGVKGQTHDQRFGNWINSSNLDTLISGKVHPGDQQAAMWAAEDADRFEQAKADYPKVRTVRGVHAKWKAAQPDPTPKPKAKPKPKPKANSKNVETALQAITDGSIYGVARSDVAKALPSGMKHVDQSLMPLVRDGKVVLKDDRFYTTDLAPVDITSDDLGKTYKAKYEALERRLRSEVEHETRQLAFVQIKDRLKTHFDKLKADVESLDKRIKNLVSGNRIKITRDEYKAIQRILEAAVREQKPSKYARPALEAFNKLGIEPLSEEDQMIRDRLPTFDDIMAGINT